MTENDYYHECFKFFNKINPNFNINVQLVSKKSDSRLTSKYLREFEELNTTTCSIYDLEENNVLIILKDGTNLTNWDDVDNKNEIIYISENLSDCNDLSNKYKNLNSLKAIVTLGVIDKVTNVLGMFSGCSNLVDISSLKDWDASNISNMKRMFRDCSSLVDISSLKDWDVSNVSNMQGVFYGCFNLVDISGLKDWDVSHVTTMPGLFEDCSNLEDISALKDWDVSNVTNMQGVFYACSNLFDVSALKDWDVSNVAEMEGMFWDCRDLVDLSGLQNWNVSGARHMDFMFRDCSSLVDISSLKDWEVSNVSHMKSMFSGCSLLVDLSYLDDWDVSNTNTNMMFDDCDSVRIYPKWDDNFNVINEDEIRDFEVMYSENSGDENISHMDVPIPAYDGDDHFAFVSYSHRDYKMVFKEIERFNKQGLNIWFDEGIAPGNEWLAEIGQALSNASLFIVFISPNSVGSKYVRKEITFAISHDIPFIAIYIEKTDLPIQLDLALGDLQAIFKYGMNDEEYYRRYTKAFNKKLKNYGIKIKSVDEL